MTASPPLRDLEPGTRLLDRFELTRELGRGGYSIVYAAIDHSVGDPVAIKVLVPPPIAAREARERLKREVQTFRAIHHPNVVGIHDFLEDHGVAFVVMDLVDGADLASQMAEHGPVAVDRAESIGREICEALVEAHRAGVLHRDLKPANILIDTAGRARLTDFGAARLDSGATLTRTGGLVGTVAYLAPEVWLGERADARADLYALGLTLYEALTGSLPDRPSGHLPPTPSEGGFRPATRRHDVPPWLDQTIATLTAADPRRRYATARQAADAFTSRRAPTPAPIALTEKLETEPPAGLPVSLYVLVGGVIATGLMAGLAASPHFYWATPTVAWLLIRAARRDRDAGRGAGSPGNRGWDLSDSERATVEALPPGPTRVLLDDVLNLARLQVDRAMSPALQERWQAQLAPAVSAAVEAAADLCQIDEILGRMNRPDAMPRTLPADWWDTVAQLERTRDGLAMALLDLMGTLSKARGVELAEVDGAGTRLRQAVTDLEVDRGRRIEALRGLEAAVR